MKKYSVRYFALFMSMILLLSFAGCGEKGENITTFLSYDDMDFNYDDIPSGTITENENWRLIWDNSNKRVSFEDKISGAVWGQIPEEATKPVYDENGMLKKNHPQLESVIQVIYQDPKSFNDVTDYSYVSAVQTSGVYCEKIKNGIRVIYDFIENEFSVPVEYKIEKKSFEISVDPAKISEGDDLKIHSISVAPFICGIKNNAEDSWLFLPDGSGTVIKPVSTGGVGTVGKQFVYGGDLSYQKYTKGESIKQINFPVYGAKKGSNALFATITSGAQSAALNWSIGNENIGYSSIYPEFCIRGFSNIKRPDSFITTTTLGSFKIFDDGIIDEKIRIKYFSLSGEKADIYGMAECYREYLKENAELKRNSGGEKNVTLKYVGATVQPSFILGIPSEKLFALTTTEQAQMMTEEIAGKIGNNININFVGFGSSGIDVREVAGGFKVAGLLGGNSGMKKLVAALNDRKIDSFMNFDLISFSKSADGFSKSSSARYPGGQIVKYTTFDNVSGAENNDRYFVLSRQNLFKAIDKLVKAGEKIGLSGISLDSLSRDVYSDYSKQKYYLGGNMQTDVKKMFRDLKDSGYKVLSSAANDYAAINSDYINDAPIYSSDYVVANYDVPFYQLVFKGFVPMSSVSLNLCTDKNDALLRCVAGGISPSYTLYYNFESELVTSEQSFIFGCEYGGNRDEIIKTVTSLKNYLDSVSGAVISNYFRLSDDVSVTVFDNGVYVAVNFGYSDVETDYGNIAAKSYITGRVS